MNVYFRPLLNFRNSASTSKILPQKAVININQCWSLQRLNPSSCVAFAKETGVRARRYLCPHRKKNRQRAALSMVPALWLRGKL